VKTPAFLLAACLLAAPFAWAQETYGTIKATTKLRPDGSKSTTILDPEKHTAEETILNAANKVLKKTTYLLGAGDVAIGAIFYDAKGNVVYKASYTRDSVGHVTEAAFSSPDDRYLGKRVFVYTTGDVATQVVDYDADGKLIAQAQPVAPKATAAKKRR
jgi:hypothetical protein